MEKKNRLNGPLFLVGAVLCVALIVVAFAIPRIGIDSAGIADMIMEKVEEAFESAKGGDEVSGIDLSAFQDVILNEENMAKAKEQIVVSLDEVLDGLSEKGIPTKLTNWQIISLSYKKLYNMAAGGDEGAYDDMLKKADSQGSSEAQTASVHEKISVGYGMFRLLVGIMTFLPFITLIFIILNYFGYLPKFPMLISTWVLAVFDMVYWVIWYSVLPRILGEAVNGIFDSILGFNSIFEIHDSALASAVLGTMNMNGFLLWNVFTVILVAWSVLCVAFNTNTNT